MAQRRSIPIHDRGRVLTDVAVMLTGGGESIADIRVLRHQSTVLGPVASSPTVWRTLDEVSRALRQGDIVMVFPEGRLTPDGEIHTFRRGLETILARDNVPVIPAGLAGLWGSWTSHYGGKALKKWPSRFRAPVSLHFGPPIAVHEVEGVALRRFLEQRVRALKAAGDSDIARRPSKQAD